MKTWVEATNPEDRENFRKALERNYRQFVHTGNLSAMLKMEKHAGVSLQAGEEDKKRGVEYLLERSSERVDDIISFIRHTGYVPDDEFMDDIQSIYKSSGRIFSWLKINNAVEEVRTDTGYAGQADVSE